MSLRCSFKGCSSYELARGDQLAFYQDINNNGWNLGLGPEFSVSGSSSTQTQLPSNIRLVDTGNTRLPYTVICERCGKKLGKVNTICGFTELSVNFSSKEVILLPSKFSVHSANSASKWSKIIDSFPNIRKITASIPQGAPLVGFNTVHFHGATDLSDVFAAGKAVANRSNLNPRRFQWRSYFFSCLNNVLLCLPTGMGKTLIANMLMKAYHQRNPEQGQVFIVPTVVLVEQQATTIERNTGLKVQRRSGEHKADGPWSPNEICVCTPAILNQSVKLKQIAISQLSLMVLDEVHEGNSELSEYGRVISFIEKCSPSQRPRILALTASPSGVSTDNILECINSMCSKLGAKPFCPLLNDDMNTDEANDVTTQYIECRKTSFEISFESFVFESIEALSRKHDFFIPNWKAIPTNVASRIKIECVLNILSHSELVARNTGDIELLQISQFMLKWIDSLSMLQIFGSRKLIHFIKEDLDFAYKNDSLSKVITKIGPLLVTMKLKIQQLEREHNIEEDLPRTMELLRIIKSHQSDQKRILVFVERRNTAERLCRRLKDDPQIEKMNPEYIIGNSNGGFPKELQKVVMDKFHSGECQVMVATTVLEQGIDVAACGVVICYDGVKTMKSIIQSRGRARQSASSFIVFVQTDGIRRVNEMTANESVMNNVIKQLMNRYNADFDPIIGQEINKFLDTSEDEVAGATAIDDLEEEDDFDELDLDCEPDSPLFTMRFFNYVNAYELANYIRSFYNSPLDRLRTYKKHIVAQFALQSPEDRLTLVKNISSTGHQVKSSNYRSWIEFVTPELDKSIFEISIDFNSVKGFHFKSYVTVNVENSIISNLCTMTINKNEIRLTFGQNHFSIRAIDVDGQILINETNDSLEVFLCLRNPPSYFIDDERAAFNFMNRSFNFCLSRNKPIGAKMSLKLRLALQNFSLEVYNVCHLKREKFEDVNQSGVNMEPQSFTKSLFINAWHSRYAAVLPAKLPSELISRFNSCSSLTHLELLLDMTVPERFRQLEIPYVKADKLPFKETGPPANFAWIGHINITPSRIIHMPMMPIQVNRVYRYFPNPENFLLVNFSDEHDGNPWRSKNIYDWFLSKLILGIEVEGRQFNFLGCSNSQLREGHCWFSCLDRAIVYNRIGQFPNEWSAGRKLSRLALAFASSIETVALEHSRYLQTVSPDIEAQGICFSDGIGRGSVDLFKRLRKIMNIPHFVSAFQIRVGGVKGVVSIYNQAEDVTFRKSMKKFESKHNILEVLNYSRPIPVTLNRHIILMLSSFDIPDEVFLDMQYNELANCLEALTNDKMALAFVKSHSTMFNWELFPEEKVVAEPIFRQMLVSNAIGLLSDLVEHAHIAVNEGRVLMGVLDETGELNYGEVFAHVVEEDLDKVLSGKVLVYRNPCVLPSDIRILNARNTNLSSRFTQLYRNCLVFPSHGLASHASECSGGDLDGDLYYVIWDERLIPKSLQVPGLEVIEVKTTQSENPHVGNSDIEMMTFFCDYVSKNQLGMIANAHLATADKYGMSHEKSVELARYVTAETDAPKKGLTVGQVRKELMPTEYPDYMQKNDKAVYRSDTVLGELFRQAIPILGVLYEKRVFTTPQTSINMISNTKNVETYYSQYCFEIKRIMQSFHLESEVDLFSGVPIWRRGYMSEYKKQTQLRVTLLEIVKQFWKKWIVKFEEWRIEISNDKKLIQEWYCRPKSCKFPAHSFSFLALPYIELDCSEKKSITDSIQLSTMQWIYFNKISWGSEYRRRYNAGIAIMQKLDGIDCHFYGSSMLALSEEYSDLDVYAADQNLDNLELKLKAIDKNAIAKKKPHRCVSLTYDSLAVDVTNFLGGVSKSYGLAETFDETPGLWPALRVLLEWARNMQVVKSGGSEGIMTVVSFCHLFIYVSTSRAPKTTSSTKPYTLARFNNWIEMLKDSPCGTYILEFLKYIRNPKNKALISTKTDPLSGEPLIKSGLIDELRKSAEVAMYILAVEEGDIRKLFQFCSKKRLFRIHKRYMDPNSSEGLIKQNMIEIEAKCNPKKNRYLTFKLLPRNGLFYLEVTGENKLFADVERGLTRITHRISNSRVKSFRNNNVYHVVNGTMIIQELGYGIQQQVAFAMYQNEQYHPQHTGMMKSVLKLRGTQQNVNWRSTEGQRFEARFIRQLQMFKSKQRMLRKGQRVWRFFGDMYCTIRVGSHYLFDVPETLYNTFETITLQQVIYSICQREEAFALETQENIARELQKYNPLTLIIKSNAGITKAPLALMPLNEVKMRTGKQPANIQATAQTTISKRSNGIKHSFYPHWDHGLAKAKDFALSNGFKEVTVGLNDQYTTVSAFWRERELVVNCNQNGLINEIRHRATRWFSTTFKRAAETGNDVRAYLETRAPLDEDDEGLETVIEFLNGRSVFTEEFARQIEQRNKGVDEEPFSARPLIAELFHLNWRFRSMRRVTPILKFVNDGNDVLILNEIYDGIFRLETREFEWFPKHYELEIKVCMDKISEQDLCTKSFVYSLKLFDATK